jgi:hypothetical protein
MYIRKGQNRNYPSPLFHFPQDPTVWMSRTLRDRIARRQQEKEEEADREKKEEEHTEKLRRERERQQEKLRRLNTSESLGMECEYFLHRALLTS